MRLAQKERSSAAHANGEPADQARQDNGGRTLRLASQGSRAQDRPCDRGLRDRPRGATLDTRYRRLRGYPGPSGCPTGGELSHPVPPAISDRKRKCWRGGLPRLSILLHRFPPGIIARTRVWPVGRSEYPGPHPSRAQRSPGRPCGSSVCRPQKPRRGRGQGEPGDTGCPRGTRSDDR
jgi:hypothetical protein